MVPRSPCEGKGNWPAAIVPSLNLLAHPLNAETELTMSQEKKIKDMEVEIAALTEKIEGIEEKLEEIMERLSEIDEKLEEM